MAYIFVNSEVRGPLETDELVAAVAAETITAETLVWNEQGEEWIALGQARPELFSEAVTQPAESESSTTEAYRWYDLNKGINRALFAALMAVAWGIGLSYDKLPSPYNIGLILGAFGCMIFAIGFRLINIGRSPWLMSIMFFIPILNVLLVAYCLIMPPGFAKTKKLDTTSKVLWAGGGALAAFVLFRFLTT
jgi:uncharacterized membrane protein